MDNPLGIYEKALFGQPLQKKMEDAARAGYDCFEISIDETNERLRRLDWKAREFEFYRKAADDIGIRLFSVCLSAHRRFSLGSADGEIEREARRILQAGIRFCSKLGVRVLQIAGYDVFYEPSTQDTGKRYLENLRRGAELAAGEGVMLALEPVEKHVISVKKAMQIAEEVDSPWLIVYPDVANLFTMGFDPAEELALAKHRIAAVHMREAPDDAFLPFGTGELDFQHIFQTLSDADFYGPLVVELWNENNPDYMKIITDAKDFLEKEMLKISGGGNDTCMND